MKPLFVCVEWLDASDHPSMSLKDVLEDETIVRSYGLLAYKDQKYHILLHHEVDRNDCDWIKIPNSLVRKVIYYKQKGD